MPRSASIIRGVLAFVAVTVLAVSQVPQSEVRMKTPEEVRHAHEVAWMKLRNVIGTGVGEEQGRARLVVFVSAPHESHATIPAEVDGYAVRVEVVGSVEALGGE